MKDKSFVISGLHYGEHGLNPEDVFLEIEACAMGGKFAMIRPNRGKDPLPDEFWYELAKYCKEHEIYFMTLYAVQYKDKDGMLHIKREVVEKMYEIAEGYFWGDSLGETGTHFATFPLNHAPNEYRIQSGFDDMQTAKDHYVSVVKNFTNLQRENGFKITWNLESAALMKYSYEAGTDFCNVELMLGNPEHLLAFARGAAKGYGKEFFGTYVAHEWYGGMRQTDPLKEKRLPIVYAEAYLAGSNMLVLESGAQKIDSFEQYPFEHSVCKKIRKNLYKFNQWIAVDKRPKFGPIVKVAFISGNLDGYAGNSMAYGGVSSSVWAQHDKKTWGYGAAEFSFNILDEVYRSCDWHNTVNYGDADYSHAPAYGQYDVLPIESDLSVMKQYDWLIFSGWNTMTTELCEKLKQYAAGGGNLFISAAHLKTTARRDVKGKYITDENISDFLGCSLTGKSIQTNSGFKFSRNSSIQGLLYPGVPGYVCDAVGSAGYTTYAAVEMKGGIKAAVLSDSFLENAPEEQLPVLIENQYGAGNVLFMTTEEYPGSAGVYPLYKLVVKTILTATHRMCDIKVICNDKVRFSVFENDTEYKVYLLNTDMNIEQRVLVCYKGEKKEKTLQSTDIDYVVFEKNRLNK